LESGGGCRLRRGGFITGAGRGVGLVRHGGEAEERVERVGERKGSGRLGSEGNRYHEE
jgi:hypothetical protein